MSSDSKKSSGSDGLAFAKAVAQLAEDNRCEDVVILDLRGLSPVTDFFVIATGSSGRQLHATAEEIDEYAKGIGERPFSAPALDSSSWVLLDYVDVIIHLFDAERRRYYDLELLWGDAPRLDWQQARSA
jgi:ribosome-associated protein